MVYSEGAKIIDAKELKEMIENECSNPTIEQLYFLETRTTEKIPGKIFPCFMEAWGIQKGKTNVEKDELAFNCFVAQHLAERGYGMINVIIRESELGVSKRIWDKPPTKALRDEHPFLETEVKQ